MRAIMIDEMRSVTGGESQRCGYCKKTFKDTKIKILGITFYYKSGTQKWAQHLRKYGTTCMYA